MLNPGDRTLLFDSLRPPDQYALDRAVGTSYSLDLLALLSAPLAFAFFDCDDNEGRPTTDPLALLEAARRHARKISLFCQAGETQPPPPSSPLIAYVEESVIPVNAPRKDGVFHPKVWCLRFVSENLPVRYRVLVLSRNLTFDRSWDTVLRLDGELKDRQKGYAANRPLSEFIAELPNLAVTPVAAEVAAAIASMAEEVRRVEFELPPDVDKVVFWPLGLSTRGQMPFKEDTRRLLIMSPFLSAGLLDEFVDGLAGCVLISRPDQLAAMPREILAKFEQVFALDPAVEDWVEPGSDQAEPALSGLHAKLFVEDAGRYASTYTGSANATDAAFERNVEFLVELQGRKSLLGIDALLDPDKVGRSPFLSLLQRWNPPEDFKPADDAAQKSLDRKLARARRAIASAAMHLEVAPWEAAYRISIVADAPLELETGVSVRCWPAFLRPELGVGVTERRGELASFVALPLAALNGFVACEVSTTVSGLAGASRFAFNLPLNGAPPDRLSRILASILSDKDRVRRLLWLLLEGQHDAIIGAFQQGQGGTSRHTALTSYEGYPLFEQMVGALAEDRTHLREIGRLIRDLATTPQGMAILPDGLLALWESLETAMEQSDGQARPA